MLFSWCRDEGCRFYIKLSVSVSPSNFLYPVAVFEMWLLSRPYISLLCDTNKTNRSTNVALCQLLSGPAPNKIIFHPLIYLTAPLSHLQVGHGYRLPNPYLLTSDDKLLISSS
jgi:hypothetical protein